MIIGDVYPVEGRFRAVNDYAGMNGYAGSFPNFHQSNHGEGLVFGVVLLNNEVAVQQDVSARELNNPTTVEERFRAINDYAGRNGYSAGFPNFHQADHGSGLVYGAVLLKHGVVRRDVKASELSNPQTIEERFRAVNDYAGRNGYSAGFPNFHQADHGDGLVYGVVLFNDGATIPDVKAISLLLSRAGGAKRFPIQVASQEDKVRGGGDFRMKTSVVLSNTGRIDGETRTWSKDLFNGFTGCVVAYLIDKDGNYLWNTGKHSYGVNGINVPGGPNDRTEWWTDNFPADLTERIAGAIIRQNRCENPRWDETLEESRRFISGVGGVARAVREVSDEVVKLIENGATIYAIVA